ncbi:MAG: hypothetical protein IPJ65_21650 [Archangiaceae bacterium]|nr:hypothetical protein [Archangiaceae bacterium]
MKRRALPVLFLMLLTLLACSPGGPGGTGGSGGEGGSNGRGGTGGSAPGLLPDGGYDVPDDQRAFCADDVAAYCDQAARCGEYSTASGCMAVAAPLLQPLCLSLAALNKYSITAGRMRFDPAAARRCVDSTRTAACGANLSFPCADVFVGQVATGGACYQQLLGSFDCGSADYCDATATCPGVCTRRKGPGEKSNGGVFVADCRPELTRTSSDYCVEWLPPGAFCRSVDGGSSADLAPCTPGAFCDSSTDRCVARQGEGATCSSSQQCRSGLACLGGHCAVRPAGGLGQPCDEPRVYNTCPGDLRCDAPPRATDGGHCAARSGSGTSCFTTSDCAAGLLCHGAPSYPYDGGMGTCGGLPKLGDPCDTLALCLEGWCDPKTARCAAPRARGAACDPTRLSCDFAHGDICDPTTRVCIAPKAIGESCDPSGLFICGIRSFCSQGSRTCAPTRAVGDSCSGRDTQECWLGTCKNGVCAPVDGYCLDPALYQ